MTTTTINVLGVIIQYGLSVRQIPKEVTHLCGFSNGQHKEGNEIVLHKLADNMYAWHAKKNPTSPDFVLDHEKRQVYRRYSIERVIPKNAGCWMCKQVLDTSSRVAWSIALDNLAPTLEESVAKFLEGLAAEKESK